MQVTVTIDVRGSIQGRDKNEGLMEFNEYKKEVYTLEIDTGQLAQALRTRASLMADRFNFSAPFFKAIISGVSVLP